jgi:hypothetical protein
METHPASAVVLSIPELASLICEFASRKDRTRLLLVSRCLFRCAVPFVWKDADILRVLYLIPRMQLWNTPLVSVPI